MSEPPTTSSQPVASRIHTLGLLVILVAWAWAGALAATKMRSNSGPPLTVFYSAAAISEWLLVAYIAAGVRRQRGSLRELIGGSWARGRDLGRDLLVGLMFWIVSLACLGALRFVIHANRGVDAVRFVAPQTKVEAVCWVLVSLTAGICEETIFRGYLQRQFIALSGKPSLGILLSAAVFGLVHVYQSAKQAIIIGVFGALFGILAYRRHSLRPGIMVHAWNDTIFGLAMHFLPK